MIYILIMRIGKDFGIIGAAGYFLNNKVYDVGFFTLFLFQMVFMDTTATIPTGGMAERWKFKSFVVLDTLNNCFYQIDKNGDYDIDTEYRLEDIDDDWWEALSISDLEIVNKIK